MVEPSHIALAQTEYKGLGVFGLVRGTLPPTIQSVPLGFAGSKFVEMCAMLTSKDNCTIEVALVIPVERPSASDFPPIEVGLHAFSPDWLSDEHGDFHVYREIATEKGVQCLIMEVLPPESLRYLKEEEEKRKHTQEYTRTYFAISRYQPATEVVMNTELKTLLEKEPLPVL